MEKYRVIGQPRPADEIDYDPKEKKIRYLGAWRTVHMDDDGDMFFLYKCVAGFEVRFIEPVSLPAPQLLKRGSKIRAEWSACRIYSNEYILSVWSIGEDCYAAFVNIDDGMPMCKVVKIKDTNNITHEEIKQMLGPFKIISHVK